MATIVEGWFTHRNYRNAQDKLETTMTGEEKIRFSLALPVTSATVHEPFQVVLAQHGFGNVRQGMLYLADPLARAGMATLTIDAPNHGSRGPSDNVSEDFLTGIRKSFGVWTDGNHITFRA